MYNIELYGAKLIQMKLKFDPSPIYNLPKKIINKEDKIIRIYDTSESIWLSKDSDSIIMFIFWFFLYERIIKLVLKDQNIKQ